jgi:flagellin-specific chaperone FliS
MMTFAKFEKLTRMMVTQSATLDQAHKLKIDLLDFVDDYSTLISELWSVILTSEGVDWFSWFMYEKNYISNGIGDLKLTAYDDGKEICRDLPELYEYLVNNSYFKIEATL